jgi:2-epi-5-epi-valiolone 7-phosphate 2-epimerase
MVSIGVCQWSLDARGPDALVRAAELGFSAIHLDGDDLAIGDWWPDGPGAAVAIEAASARTGVTIAAVAPGRLNQLGLTSPAGSEEARSCERSIAVAIHAAARLGASLIYLPSFVNGEIRDESGLRRTAEAMQGACDLAAADGLLVATENTLSATDNLRLLASVDRPNARVLLDTQNPALWGHDVAAYLDALWPHLANQVHVKDGRDGRMGNAPLGDGEAGFAATIAALKAHGFDGSLISENDYSGDAAGRAAHDVTLLTRSFPTGA